MLNLIILMGLFPFITLHIWARGLWHKNMVLVGAYLTGNSLTCVSELMCFVYGSSYAPVLIGTFAVLALTLSAHIVIQRRMVTKVGERERLLRLSVIDDLDHDKSPGSRHESALSLAGGIQLVIVCIQAGLVIGLLSRS